jgi:PHD/YefM family antitoxin component YafN of YafNO toxin-antitoxin module
MLKTQSINLETFGEDVENHIDKIINKNLDELIITTPFENDVVIIPIKEYERLKNLFNKTGDQNVK